MAAETREQQAPSGRVTNTMLARFRNRRCKADGATIAASLQGNWREEHLFALQQARTRHDMLRGQIEECEARIDAGPIAQ